MILRILFLCTVLSVTYGHRFKRDFMFVTDSNSSETECFEECNEKYRHDFEYSFNVNTTDFYDFPFHPIVLRYSSFLLFCRLAQQRTECYQNKCGDTMASSMFSPANFICNFKRKHFVEARPCLAEAETRTFVKCDKECHDKVMREKINAKDEPNKIFSLTEMENYELELDKLCSFQSCYLTCVEPILDQTCSPTHSSKSYELLKSLVEWHAADIYDWHLLNEREQQLPESCRELATSRRYGGTDPVLKFFSES